MKGNFFSIRPLNTMILLVALVIHFVGAWQQSHSALIPFARDIEHDEVNISNFPRCATANCITSQQFSPSRLGCIEETLDTECFCKEAPTPLSCAPSGPSDENNCWYEMEDWFAGVCNGSVAQVNGATVPECTRTCIFAALSTLGCRSPTRNCFCILSRQPVIDAAKSCLSHNCARKMRSSFSPESWRDTICKLGEVDVYDQARYDRYIRKVHDTRIAVPVVVCITLFPAAVLCWILTGSDSRRSLKLLMTGLIMVIGLAIILPVEFAL